MKQDSLELKDQNNTITVENFQFEPIKGYPMLNWRGKRSFTSTQYFPAQKKEEYGSAPDGWRNRIYWGDNLQVMSHLLKEFRGGIDLVYIDPPFDSKADYKKSIKMKGKSAQSDQTAFEEKQYTDIWANDEYLQFMYERLLIIKELMSDGATFYLHCDPKRSHLIRCLLDEIFGESCFVNEIIWQKTRVSKGQSLSFGAIHDVIFIYSKGPVRSFNPQFLPHSEDYIRSHYNYFDENGRRYGLWDFTQAGQGPARKFGDKELAPPPGKHWIWSQEKIDQGMQEGRIEFTSSGMPRLRRYFDSSEGKRIGDIWDDVLEVNSQAEERLGYPTQKPESLLTRIVKASSNPGDIVFDCFMGSGTTQAVAMKFGRRFIGADINLGSIQTATKRFSELLPPHSENCSQLCGFEVYNVNSYDIFRNPVEARDLLIEALEIQKLDFNSVYDGEKDGRMVKIMSVNRIATRADLSELIAGFDYKTFEKRQQENPARAVEKILLVCMGHEPDLKAHLQKECGFKLDVEIVDILRDKSKLEFKRESEAKVILKDGKLVIERFYPMNLLQKLSLQKETVTEWRELVESVMIDWNYDGAVLQPSVVDIPEKNEFVSGSYLVPTDAGTIRVKITDLLSESLELEVRNG